MMTRLPYAVFLSVLLFSCHAKKTDNKSDPASSENEKKLEAPAPVELLEWMESSMKNIKINKTEKAKYDKFVTNFFDKWYNKLWLYPTIMIADWMVNHDDLEPVPYETIKKFDVS